jgi:hypothetical protein
MPTKSVPAVTRTDWVSLRDHFGVRLTALQELLETRIAAIETGIRVALVAMEKRLDGMNEWRGSMNDREKFFANKIWIEGQLEAIKKDMADLKQIRDIATGRATQSSVYVAYALTIISIIIGVVSLVSNLAK